MQPNKTFHKLLKFLVQTKVKECFNLNVLSSMTVQHDCLLYKGLLQRNYDARCKRRQCAFQGFFQKPPTRYRSPVAHDPSLHLWGETWNFRIPFLIFPSQFFHLIIFPKRPVTRTLKLCLSIFDQWIVVFNDFNGGVLAAIWDI